MAGEIIFNYEDTDYRLQDEDKVALWVKGTIVSEGYAPGVIAFIFSNPENHLEINRKYLGHDYPTDVITFEYTEEGSPEISGDIFIDPVTVADNALLYETGMDNEMLRVIIHGTLHLCGYGDKTEEETKTIRQKEDQYLKLLQSQPVQELN